MTDFVGLALRAGPWIAAVLAIGFGLVERADYFAEKAARAGDLAAAVRATPCRTAANW